MTTSRGFTLVEVMIVVAIVAILASLAYPSYQDHVMKSQRTEGTVALLNFAQQLERCYTEKNKYNDAACPLQGGAETTENGYYQISAVVTATTYTLTATPVKGAVLNDTKCGNLGINQNNVKTETGSLTVQDCW